MEYNITQMSSSDLHKGFELLLAITLLIVDIGVAATALLM